MNAKKITVLALLVATASIIHIIEAQIPGVVPIPGVKPGLANIVTVYAMFTFGPVPTLAVLLCRIALGSIFSGQVVTALYSMSGGILCYASMLVMRRLVSQKQIWVSSATGAIFHNIGQVTAAIAITRTPALIAYLPFLFISGICTGVFTGLCAQFIVRRLPYRDNK